jgi:hypothetical protein
LIGFPPEQDFETWNQMRAFVMISGRLEIDSTGPGLGFFVGRRKSVG